MKTLLTSLTILLTSLLLSSEPIVSIELPGLLGNRLFGYCMAKIIAEHMHWKVYCGPIWGFPDTYSCESNYPSSEYRTEIIYDAPGFNLDINPIINDKTLRNLKLNGYFQNYATLKPFTEQIRNDWLKIDKNILLPKKYNSIVVHIRALYPDAYFIPFEYYQKALNMAIYDQLYICTDDPLHPFLRNFDVYNPIIVSFRNLDKTMSQITSWPEISKLNMDDFLFMQSFDKIICSFSTYSWWAAFLSEATEIYAPYPTNDAYQYLIVDEDRYHYIETTIGIK